MSGEGSIVDYITCPVCRDYIRPPSWCCENGHFVCSECKFACCPVCKTQRYPNKGNSVFDSILKEIYYPCENQELGCTGFFKYNQIKQHQGSCSFRVAPCTFQSLGCRATLSDAARDEHEDTCKFGVKCKVYMRVDHVEYVKCTWKGAVEHLAVHVFAKHPSHWLSNEVEMNVPTPWLLPLEVDFQKVEFVKLRDSDEMFYIHLAISPSVWQRFAVQYIGAHEKSLDFRFVIEFSHGTKKFMYENAVVSPQVRTGEVFESPYCLESRYGFLNKHFSAERLIDYYITVKRNDPSVLVAKHRSITYQEAVEYER